MDAKTLEKMTVSKLRDEALKFEDLSGVHGMQKPELLTVLKAKYGIVEEHHESAALLVKKHTLKQKIKTLKAEQAQALEGKDAKKSALLQKRLHQHRRRLKKTVKRINAA